MDSSKGNKKWLMNKRATLGSGFALLLLVSIGIVSYLQFFNFKQSQKWVDHTRTVLNKNQEILNLVTDAETG